MLQYYISSKLVLPSQRCRMNSDSGVEYIKAWQLGETITGLGGVGEVVDSADPNFVPGDLVTPNFEWPWKTFFVFQSSQVRKVSMYFIAISSDIPYVKVSIENYFFQKEKRLLIE